MIAVDAAVFFESFDFLGQNPDRLGHYLRIEAGEKNPASPSRKFGIPIPSSIARIRSMAKGYELHQARMMALQAMGKDLARRAKSRCEITGASGIPLRAYEVPPVGEDPDIDRTLLVSQDCLDMLDRPERLAGRTWQCLAEAVWSDFPAVQVVAWRMLAELAKREDWAREALDGVFLDPEVESWARSEGR